MNNGLPEQPSGERVETAGDAVIHWAATISVITVTAIAAVMSYGHARELVIRYGVTGRAADTLPLTIDGLVATCSLILVDCARHERPAPWHAWVLLITGACAQVAANVAAGLSHGIVGAIIAGWPAFVACGCFELLLHHRRHARPPASSVRAVPDPSAGPASPELPEIAGLPGDPAVARARELYGAGIAAGHLPSIRAIKRDLHVGTGRASLIQAALTAPTEATSQAA
jgi:hypothetical protein